MTNETCSRLHPAIEQFYRNPTNQGEPLMDRRTFLKTGAGASAGLMAANTAMGRD